jgi:hypothetical protein
MMHGVEEEKNGNMKSGLLKLNNNNKKKNRKLILKRNGHSMQ